jgi:phosphoglycerate kinase
MARKLVTIDQLELAGKRVFIRVDFNIPLTGDGRIIDDARIRAAIPTIRHAMERGAKVILATHLGRPEGDGNDRQRFSLEPAATRLSELMERDIILADDCVGDGVQKLVKDLEPGGILMLENLRFHKEEVRNDELFARELAAIADVWVNDAFGAIHRSHASTAGMARFVREKAAGFLVQKEIEVLTKVLRESESPFVTILGGAKVSDKIKVIENLLLRVDTICIGGAMAFTFLKAQGVSVGRSRVEGDRLELARSLLEKATQRGVEVLLPVDHICAVVAKETAARVEVKDRSIPDNLMGLDIGPRTLGGYRQRILDAKTVFWNGPMGLFEQKPWAEGTEGIARAMAESEAMTVVGGGDTAVLVEEKGLVGDMTHVSTGGGATLEFIEGRILPGVQALEE